MQPGSLHRLLLAGLATWSMAASTHAQSARQRQRELQRTLRQPVTVAWQDQRLGVAAARLGALYDVPVWRDRRVDPNRSITLVQSKQPLADVFAAMVADGPLSVAVLPDLVYLGPAEAGDQLETLLALRRADLSAAPSTVRRVWLTPTAIEWPRLSEPRQILADLVAQAGAELTGDERVPHDLWAARTLKIAPLDLATIVLFGFDLTPSFDQQGERLEVVAIERPIQIVRTYPFNEVARQRVAQFAAELPTGALTLDGARATLAGTLADHRRLANVLRGQAETPSSPVNRPKGRRQEQVYTLQIENQPVGPTVAQLARQLGLSVAWQVGDDDAAIRAQRISCEVREATLAELFDALLEPAGLVARQDGKQLTIVPR